MPDFIVFSVPNFNATTVPTMSKESHVLVYSSHAFDVRAIIMLSVPLRRMKRLQ